MSLIDELGSIGGAISSWRFLRNWRWWVALPLLVVSLTVMLPAFALLIAGAVFELAGAALRAAYYSVANATDWLLSKTLSPLARWINKGERV